MDSPALKIKVAFNTANSWPKVFTDWKEFVSTVINTFDIAYIELEGEATLLVYKEFKGLSMPCYINDWVDLPMRWYGDNAKFIIANLATAYKANKASSK